MHLEAVGSSPTWSVEMMKGYFLNIGNFFLAFSVKVLIYVPWSVSGIVYISSSRPAKLHLSDDK